MSQSDAKIKENKSKEARLQWIMATLPGCLFGNLRQAGDLLDEAQHILVSDPKPEWQINYLLYRANWCNNKYAFEEAYNRGREALNLLELYGDYYQLAEAHIDCAGFCFNLGKYDEGAGHIAKTENVFKSIKSPSLQARLFCRQGYMALNQKLYSDAMEAFWESSKFTPDTLCPETESYTKDMYFQTLVYSGMGEVYNKNEDFVASKEAYGKAIKICEELGIRTRLSWHYLSAGNACMSLKEYEQAEKLFLKALETSDDLSTRSRDLARANIGACLFFREAYDEALAHLKAIEESQGEEQKPGNRSIVEGWLSRIYHLRKEDDKALYHARRALHFALKSADPRQISVIYADLAQFHADQKEFEQAYACRVEYDIWRQRHLDYLSEQKISELSLRYESKKQKQEAQVAKLRIIELQLKALRAQMNPHFMYNALNSIQQYIMSEKSAIAAKYLAKFAKLMRQSLDYSNQEIISLEKELEFLRDYLYINEKLRFEDALQWNLTVDPDIESDIVGVPSMIVQPYVENAIEHGLKACKGGLLQIHFSYYDDDTLLCVVEDNGIGRVKAREQQVFNPRSANHRSMGTSITEERLQVLFQGRFDKPVEIIDLTDTQTQNPTGTRVEIRIPIFSTFTRSAIFG